MKESLFSNGIEAKDIIRKNISSLVIIFIISIPLFLLVPNIFMKNYFQSFLLYEFIISSFILFMFFTARIVTKISIQENQPRVMVIDSLTLYKKVIKKTLIISESTITYRIESRSKRPEAWTLRIKSDSINIVITEFTPGWSKDQLDSIFTLANG